MVTQKDMKKCKIFNYEPSRVIKKFSWYETYKWLKKKNSMKIKRRKMFLTTLSLVWSLKCVLHDFFIKFYQKNWKLTLIASVMHFLKYYWDQKTSFNFVFNGIVDERCKILNIFQILIKKGFYWDLIQRCMTLKRLTNKY